MSIWIVSGKPRHGKTTFTCREIMDWQRFYKRQGEEPRQILSNVPIYLPGVQVMGSWREIQRQSKLAIVVIDEAASWFSAHTSKENQQFIDYFTQHGKDGNTIYLICHHPEMLDVSIRSRTCEGIWRVKRLFGPTKYERPSNLERWFGWWAIARLYDSRDYGKETKQRHWRSCPFRIDSLHGTFDTLARVGDISQVGIQRGAGLAAGPLAGAQAAGAHRQGLDALAKRVLTKEEYFKFSKLKVDEWGNGISTWEGPLDVDMYDRVRLALEDVA